MDIEEEIETAFREWWNATDDGNADVSEYIMPLVKRAQAEALREAAEEMDADVSHLNANHPGELAYINCTRIDAQELRYRADRIEQEVEHD